MKPLRAVRSAFRAHTPSGATATWRSPNARGPSGIGLTQAIAIASLAVLLGAAPPPAPLDPATLDPATLDPRSLPSPTELLKQLGPTEELLRAAQANLASGDAKGAAAIYSALRAANPENPELTYNLAVAKYRAGERKEAAGLFREAASGAKASVAAKAMFNQATTLYAMALDATTAAQQAQPQGPSGAAPTPAPVLAPATPNAPDGASVDPQAAMKEAKASLEESLVHFRDALRADPSDEDSRVNAEKAWRLLQSLREEEQKQEQKQEEQQDQKQDQNQENKQENDENQDQQQQDNEQQEKSDQQKQQDQKKDEQKKPNQRPDQQQQQQQNQNQQQSDQNKQDQQQNQQQQQQQQDKGDPKDQQQQQAQPTQKVQLSKEEAERLLQMVRDKEKERRAQILAKQRSKQPPVNRDW